MGFVTLADGTVIHASLLAPPSNVPYTYRITTWPLKEKCQDISPDIVDSITQDTPRPNI